MSSNEENEVKVVSEFFGLDYSKFVIRPLNPDVKNSLIVEKLSENFKKSRSVLELLLEKNRKLKEEKSLVDDQDKDWEDGGYVQLDEKTSNTVKDLISQSEKIERVCKERIFEEEITEREMDIINQRVALQQKQFAEFERREFSVKSNKIRSIFENLNDEEISLTLKKTRNNEDEAIIKLSSPGFLYEIRKEIAKEHEAEVTDDVMNEIQLKKYEELLKKRTNIQKKSTTGEVKKKYHTVGRLPLDKALEQLRKHTNSTESGDWSKNKNVNLAEAMKGWSTARINAFKAIKTKPNTYYYRFNAPGEVQRVGQWDETEKRLFHARLKEIGANGQWGIFSMTIPGRVGYQCSNYYRFLIENHKLKDPNYVLDKKGKAHYLFSTKKVNPDGTVVKEFRTHNKVPRSNKGRSKKNKYLTSEDSMSDYNSEKSNSGSGSGYTHQSNRYKGAGARGSGYKRKHQSESDDEIRANDVSLTDDSEFDREIRNNSGSDKEYYESKSRRSSARSGTRSRNRTYTSDSGRSSSTAEQVHGRDTLDGRRNGAKKTSAEYYQDDDYFGGGGIANDGYDSNYNPNNPLPDFVDPITLEKVSKPAISPYGHVMDYDSWIRCLMFPPDGSQKNICPLTKNPLTKRELVILTHDNINEYRFKIVNI
ncbi:hypothetical protein AYI70_g11850 [Smittium culicis]|uniref:Myb-like domain-containing protein n=1 Tax=Smittium culicis TaxID=133412 RepID=A0A1R1X031_9FUNG|nr:hypothetical protein AYI70_g11850 [Smittium culicis]